MFEQAYGLPEDPTSKTEVKNSAPPENRFLKAIFLMQTALCALALILCLVLKYFAGDLYSTARDFYRQNIATKANLEEVLETGSAATAQTFCNIALPQSCILLAPMQGTVTSGFGYRADPLTGTHSFHSGYDIAAAEGTAVCAAISGKAKIAALSNSSYGNCVIIESGAIRTLYGHLKTVKINTGDSVTAGQQIGECGSTGRSTGPHLHFEIQIGAHPIDPAPFLKLL